MGLHCWRGRHHCDWSLPGSRRSCDLPLASDEHLVGTSHFVAVGPLRIFGESVAQGPVTRIGAVEVFLVQSDEICKYSDDGSANRVFRDANRWFAIVFQVNWSQEQKPSCVSTSIAEHIVVQEREESFSERIVVRSCDYPLATPQGDQ